jgi:hypothetical protein
MPKEIKLKTVGEETVVQISLKNLAWGLGIVISVTMTVITWMYKDVKSGIADSDKNIKQEIQDFKGDFKDFREKEFKPVVDQQNKVNVSVGIMLDRMNNNTAKNVPLSTTPPSDH